MSSPPVAFMILQAIGAHTSQDVSDPLSSRRVGEVTVLPKLAVKIIWTAEIMGTNPQCLASPSTFSLILDRAARRYQVVALRKGRVIIDTSYAASESVDEAVPSVTPRKGTVRYIRRRSICADSKLKPQ